jgi:hypothetical protein
MRMVALAAVVVFGLGASPPPHAVRLSEQRLPYTYRQGVAYVPGGWVFSGTSILIRVNDQLKIQAEHQNAIPAAWRKRGFDHIGDIDVVGRYIYAPYEQPNYNLGYQATARYTVNTLRFVDARELPQHQNSFVTIDPKTMIAYSMDEFGGNTLIRYDVRRGWKPLPPLVMNATLQNVQGAAIADGAVWLSTSDLANDLYRVDLATGQVEALGSAGHLGGEGEGIAAVPLRSGLLHTMVVDRLLAPVWFGHFTVRP